MTLFEHQVFLAESELGTQATVMGNGQDFLIVFLDRDIPPETKRAIVDRKLSYCGVIAMRNGKPQARLSDDPTAFHAMLKAAVAYSGELARRKYAGSTKWLENLFNLPDSRNANEKGFSQKA